MSYDPTNKTDEELAQRKAYIDSITPDPNHRAVRFQESIQAIAFSNHSEYDILCFCCFWLATNMMKDKHATYHAIETVMRTLHQWHYFECEDWEIQAKGEMPPSDHTKGTLGMPTED